MLVFDELEWCIGGLLLKLVFWGKDVYCYDEGWGGLLMFVLDGCVWFFDGDSLVLCEVLEVDVVWYFYGDLLLLVNVGIDW